MQEVIEKKSIKNIDFNCDLAQSYGIYKNNNESEILKYVSSVNISCGFHAGDPLTIKESLLKAKDNNLSIGAHIGFNDIQGFGYRPVELKEDELEALVIYQLGALISYAKALNLEIEHVRPHGAMYKMVGQNFDTAKTIANAIKKCSEWLIFYMPAGEIAYKTEEETNIKVAQEIMLEKTYNPDLTIDYREDDNTNNYDLVKIFQHLIHTSQIRNNVGGYSSVDVKTIHFSNKYQNSIDLIKQVRDTLSPTPVNYNDAKISGWVD